MDEVLCIVINCPENCEKNSGSLNRLSTGIFQL